METTVPREYLITSDKPLSVERIPLTLTKNNDTFSVATYNILASCYSDYHLDCEKSYLPFGCRGPILAEQISGFDTDFICLQEVDIYDNYIKGLLDGIGYSSHYLKRPTPVRIDGSLIAWKIAKWTVVEIIDLDYNETEKSSLDLTYKHDNVGVLIVFQNIYSEEFTIIGTSHFYWDPRFDYVKFSQAMVFTEKAYDLKEKYRCDLVLTGDFNSTPNSNVIKFMLNKPIDFQEDLSDNDARIKQMYQPSRLKLKNCYADYCDNGYPDFTRYSSEFKGVIDHIMISEGIAPISLGKVPSTEDFVGIFSIPNEIHPSDHLPLIAEFSKI